MNILGTGLSGLVGSRVVELLTPDFTFENLSLETGVDITDKKSVDTYFERSTAPWVFHIAAYTDVQGAERDHQLAWKINVDATSNIVANCRKFGKKLLYVDTDYAFDGKKKSYTEEDTPNPLGWYAKTKTEGAKRVIDMGGLVIRISNPYRSNPVGLPAQPGKKDFVHKMLEQLRSGQRITGATDQLFVPTFIDDIAHALPKLMSINAIGIYHVVSSPALSPYEAGLAIADVWRYDTNLVQKTTFATMLAGRAPAPQYAALKNDKITSLGVIMHSFIEGIKEVEKQEL